MVLYESILEETDSYNMNVTLIPQYNNIPSRTEPILKTWISRRYEMKIPIIAANMDSVIGDDLADVLIEHGSIPIFHRFTSYEQQWNWGKKYGSNCFLSCGLNNIDQTIKLLKETDIKGMCIDIAHAHSSTMKNFLLELKQHIPSDKDIIVGNICTPTAFHDLANWGADAIKCGIGGGSACTTRMVTGYGVPQFSAVYECGKIAEKLRVPLIADGGIRDSRDIMLALSAGASSVMIGGLFSNTFESVAPKEHVSENGGDVTYATYRGQASTEFQIDFYGEVKKGTVPEGIAFRKRCSQSADTLINQLCGGIRSGFTYGGARTIKELQRKAEFRRVTSSFIQESKPRPF